MSEPAAAVAATDDPAPEPNAPLRLAHLAALWGFALVQPLFDLLGRNAEFFVARGSSRSDIVFWAIGVTVIPPLLLLAVEQAAGLAGAPVRRTVHLVFVWLLGAITVLGFVKRGVDASSAVLIPVALAAGAALVYGYLRAEPVRNFLTVLSGAPVLFLALFLLTSQVSKLVLHGDEDAAVDKVATRTPVIFVTFDEFAGASLMDAKGRIDPVRYPNIAKLAGQSTWFRNTTTIADGTQFAVPTVMSGKTPEERALPSYSDYRQSIFTLLGGSYDLHVTEPVTRLCPKNLCHGRGKPAGNPDARGTGAFDTSDESEDGFFTRMRSMTDDIGLVSLHLVLPQDLRRRLPSVSEDWGEFGGDDEAPGKARLPAPIIPTGQDAPENETPEQRKARLDRLRRLIDQAKAHEAAKSAFDPFVASIRRPAPNGRPPLYFIHILMPHKPWQYLPDGSGYPQPYPVNPGLFDNLWDRSPELAQRGWQRHLLQVGYVDREVGKLVARLKSTGLYDRSLIVLTADHGVAFTPGASARAIADANAGGVAPTPFILKKPSQTKGAVVERHVQSVDVLATIADALGVALPEKSDGRSAFDARNDARNVTIYRTVSISNFGKTTFPWSVVERKRADVLRRQVALFGSDTGWDSVYQRIGPNPALIGRAVGSPGAAAGGQIKLETPAKRGQPMASGIVAGLPAGAAVAIAVDGKVAAVTQPFDFNGKNRIAALLPPSAFAPGAPGTVTYYAATGSGAGASLAQMSTD